MLRRTVLVKSGAPWRKIPLSAARLISVTEGRILFMYVIETQWGKAQILLRAPYKGTVVHIVTTWSRMIKFQVQQGENLFVNGSIL